MRSSAKNDGMNFKLLSTNMLTLSLCGRAHAFVTVGPKPSTLTKAASVDEIAGAWRMRRSRGVPLSTAPMSSGLRDHR